MSEGAHLHRDLQLLCRLVDLGWQLFDGKEGGDVLQQSVS